MQHSLPSSNVDMREYFKPRLQLITGKGGVGRTTVAIALAQAFVEQGLKVLLLEVRDADSELHHDPEQSQRAQDSMLGRSLSQSLGQDQVFALGEIPLMISPKLWAAQLIAEEGHRGFLRSIIPSDRLVKAALESKALSRFLRSAPSMHELGIFYHLKYFDECTEYDKIVIDMPATGHTLALSQLPDRIANIIKKGQIVDALRSGMQRITDPKSASMWIVTLAEKLPLSEAQEVSEALLKDDIQAAGVICNRGLKRTLTDDEQALLQHILTDTPNITDASLDSAHVRELLLSALHHVHQEPEIKALIDSFPRLLDLPELSKATDRAQFAFNHWLK